MLDEIIFDLPKEKELYLKIKNNYFEIKKIAFLIFATPDPVGNVAAGRLMEKMDSYADNAIEAVEQFVDIVNEEVSHAIRNIERLDSQVRQLFWYGIFLNVILLVLIFVYIKRKIVLPIVLLKTFNQDLKNGNLNIRSGIKQADEIGDLSLSFNEMADNMKRTREELKVWSNTLEDKVKERTFELSVLYDISQAVSYTLNYRQILTLVMKSLGKIMSLSSILCNF